MTTDDLINQTLGQYEIKSLLGRGGMAAVYLARQTSMNRDVAIKVMARELADDEQFVARFEHEAQVIARLQHPHILPVIDFGRQGQQVYIVMRLVKGGSLDDRLRGGPLALNLASRMFIQIASALTFAHEQGIVHRDLKPNNVLLDERDNAYLVDFGIAKMLAGTTKLTATGNILGTPAYMAPEQWRGEMVDARTDIYSLGVMLYEMVLGRLPFSGETPYTLMYKHFNDPPPPPREIDPNLPPRIEAVILRALSKEPDARYQSADEMAQEFTAAVNDLSAAAQQVPSVQLDKTIIGEDEGIFSPTIVEQTKGASPTPQMTARSATPRVTPPVTPLEPTAARPATTSAAPAAAGSRRPSNLVLGIAAVAIIAVLGIGGFLLFDGGDEDNEPTQAAAVPTETETSEPTSTPTDTPEPTSTHTDTPEPTPTERITTAIILAQRANVRSGPGTDYEVIGSLERDQEILVIGVSEDGGWFQVLYENQLAWVSAETVRIAGNPNVPVVPTFTPAATETPTSTPEPTSTDTDTPEPTSTDTDTPEPTSTSTDIPTFTPEPPTPTMAVALPDVTSTPAGTEVAGLTVDPAIFVPTEYINTSMDALGITMDYPANWLDPLNYKAIYSLGPVSVGDDTYDLYPNIILGRGTPQELLEQELTSDISSPVNAIEHVYAIDFVGQSEAVTDFNYLAYRLNIRESELHIWVWLVEISSDDWVILISLAPIGDYDLAYESQVLGRMLSTMQIDQMALTSQSSSELASMPITVQDSVLDTFDDNLNDWRFGTIVNGGIVIDTPSLDYAVSAYPAEVTEPGPAFYIQATGRVTRAASKFEYGLIFRTASTSDFYYLYVTEEGMLNLFKVTSLNFEPIIAGTEPELMVSTGPDAANTLGALVLGDYIELYVNGFAVAAVTDATIQTGGTGLLAYTPPDADAPVAVTFDNSVFMALDVPTDPDVANTGTITVGSVLDSAVDLLITLDDPETRVNALEPGELSAVLGRSSDSRYLMIYHFGFYGWAESGSFSLTRAGTPVTVDTLPVVSSEMLGGYMMEWPVMFESTYVTLAYGDTVSGTLEDGASAQWTFEGSAGDVVTIAVNASETSRMDTYLSLAGPNAQIVAENDDDGPGLNSLIDRFSLPESGIYTVEARSVTDAGDYTLTLTLN